MKKALIAMSGEVPKSEFRCKAKIRYRQSEQWATVIPTGADTVHARTGGSAL